MGLWNLDPSLNLWIHNLPLTSPKPATKPVWSRLSSLAFRPGSVLPLLFYAHIINEPWYVAVFFMTCKCNIFNNWYVPNFVRIAGEYHITTMDGGSVPMHVMQLVGRIDHGAPLYNQGEWSITDQGEHEIGASSPVFNIARRINHIRHNAGNISPGFWCKISM